MNMKEIFERANLKVLRDFIMHGDTETATESRPYHVRLQEAREKAVRRYKECFPDITEYDQAIEEIDAYAGEIKSFIQR